MATGIVPAQVLLTATAPLRNICAACGRRPNESLPHPASRPVVARRWRAADGPDQHLYRFCLITKDSTPVFRPHNGGETTWINRNHRVCL